jgi:hypothetical protein
LFALIAIAEVNKGIPTPLFEINAKLPGYNMSFTNMWATGEVVDSWGVELIADGD